MAIRWQDWLIVLVGCWLAVSPWEIGYWLDKAASENACGVGAVLVIFNLMSVSRRVDKGQEILNILVGIWLLLSPYSLGFSSEREVAINTLLVGAIVIVLAVWQLRDAIRK